MDRPQSAARRPISRAGVAVAGGARPSSRAGGWDGGAGGAAGVKPASRGGLPPGSASGRPSVMDKSYFIREIKNKNSELALEMDNMRKEINLLMDSQNEIASLQRKQQALIEENKKIHLQLSDHNLLLDKIRTNPELAVGDLRGEAVKYRQMNEVEKSKADVAFSDRNRKEKELADTERIISELQAKFHEEITQMDGDIRNRYLSARQENDAVEEQLKLKRSELSDLAIQCQKLENEIRQDPNRQKALGLYEELYKLKKKQERLTEETQAEQLSVPQERERLLQQVKMASQQIQAIERAIEETQNDISGMNIQNQQLEKSSEETPENQAKRKKIAELQQKDQEMTEFLSSAPQTKQDLQETNTRLELVILALLEHVSKQIISSSSTPQAEKHKELQEELNEKEEMVNMTKETHEKLEDVLKAKRAEMEKMQNIDQKIFVEIESFKKKITSMKTELSQFSQIGEMKTDIENSKKQLVGEKQTMALYKEILGQECTMLDNETEEIVKKIGSNDFLQQCDVLEKQLRHQESTAFQLREYICEKLAEGDYKSLQEDVTKLVASLNAIACENAVSTI
eukprot:TRINITY_DN4113_c0_g1_i1.p1 TRINITY_DN4113_c0_g1~~TRINITY_DN4113_c0_g1_i1.p1  ORF type:complete len:572 (-),score=194.19 TRINITY_DN4113_c0_g1_i1:31-1746(-)